MIALSFGIERWELKEVFATSRDAIAEIAVVVATLTDAVGRVGRGEAAGVDYDGETPESMCEQLTHVAGELDTGTTGRELEALLPAGGARNALDCALWDLRAKQHGVPAWRAAGLEALRPVETCLTIGLDDEATTRRKAREARDFPLLKLKLDAERHLEVVRWVREEQPSARLIVDANQAWSRGLLERLLPGLERAGVELVEQPVPRAEDAALDGLRSPIPLAADESCVDRRSLPALAGRYQFVNIKLDKCGGLTEALALRDAALKRGFGIMVGNMCGSSLAMAPAFLIAQGCRYVDLDGPLLQRRDREPPIRFEGARMQPPPGELWG